MKGKRKPVVIAYDIVCNKRRARAARCLQKWHLDKQYSLYECLLTEREAEELFLQLSDLIDDTTDYLLFAWLDKHRKSYGLTRNSTIGFSRPLWYVG